MIVNSGLGNDSSDFSTDSDSSWTFYIGLGIAAFLVLKVLDSKKQNEKARIAKKKLTRKQIIRALDKKVPKRKVLSQKEAKGIFGDIL